MLFDVSSRGKVRVAGPDAARFLHNLCSNDVLNLPVGSGCEAFLLTVKARVVAHGLIYRTADQEFWLDVDAAAAAKTLKHLDHYLISEQLELTDQTADLAQLYVAGPEARAVLEKTTGALPDLADRQVTPCRIDALSGCQVRRRDLGGPGYDVLGPADQKEAAAHLLTRHGATPTDLSAYDVLRVEAGWPAYGVDVDETHLAPEVGRTARAISYAKGCYLGQEPVVRIRDLGQVQRSLQGLRFARAVVPPGTKLTRDGAEAGHVTSAVVSPRFGPIGLGYVRRGGDAPGTVVEVETEGGRQTAVVAALPFSGSGAGAAG